MDISEFSSLTFLFSFSILIFMFFKVTTQFKTKPLNPPPGPRKFPIIGNLHLFANSQLAHRTITDLSLKYGDIMHLQFGEVNTIVVSSPEIAKQVLKTHDTNFLNRPSLLAAEILSYGNADIAFGPYGEYWRQLRKICTLELLSRKRVQSFRPIREEEFSNLCRWIASKEGSSINLTEEVALVTFNVVTRVSLGKKTSEHDKLMSILKEVVDPFGALEIADLYPSIKLFRMIGGTKGRVERLHREADKILENIINDHKLAKVSKNVNDGSENHEDLVDVLLKFSHNGDNLQLTTDSIKAIIQDMFFAGTETSSTTLDWAMAEMLKHPTIMTKAQDEVRRVFEEIGYVDESHLHKLNYTKLIIKETLRMHPPAPLLIPRESNKLGKINGYQIPAKARVLVNAWSMGRDPRYWKEADSFKPERFLENTVDYMGNDFEYIPFGAGKRICPGILFGLANMELPLAMFLYHFDWVLPNGMNPQQIDMTEMVSTAVGRKNPLYVIPIVRKPLPVL